MNTFRSSGRKLARYAVVPGHCRFLEVARAAEDLDRGIDDAPSGQRCVGLGHRHRPVLPTGHSDISVANEVTGSLTGSRRPQMRGHAGPYTAIMAVAGRHVRPHLASLGHISKMSSKQ